MEIRRRIDEAARAAGRDPASVRLVAVSKGQPVAAIREALSAGQVEFGENYAQELLAKAAAFDPAADAAVGAAACPAPAWRYQGTLQRRKIRDLLPVITSFDSVARLEELIEVARRAEAAQRNAPVPCLLEVNIGSEPQKNGVLPDEIGKLLEAASRFPLVAVRGLMTVPPDDDDPARWFSRLREAAERFALRELSMGMSADFEAAVREGATIVRIGTALFGPRTPRSAPG